MSKKRLIGALVVSLLVAAGAAVRAEQGILEEEGLRLSLADSLSRALENNLDIVLSRKDPRIAEQNVEAQAASFDPVVSGGGSYSESVEEVFNPTSPNENWSMGVNGLVSQQLKFGGDYSAELSAATFESTAPAFSIASAYASDLSLTFNLPLLRGFGSDVATEQLVVARRNLEISEEDFRRQVHTTLETVEGAYWDVVAARDALEVALQSLRRAEDLLALNRKKVEVGTLAPIEITQAEAEVAAQEERVIVAETTLEDAEDELRRLLAIPPDDPLWGRRILPTDAPSIEQRNIVLGEAIETALDSRPELISARKELRNKELGERVAKNALRPQLDLQANVNPQGNNFVQDPGPDGILNTFDDSSRVSGTLDEALRELPKFDNYDLRVSLQYSVPIGNRAAKAGYAIAQLDREKSEVGLSNLEQTVRVEVRATVRGVESGLKRVEAANANVTLQQKKLEAEQKKYENGMSTSFEVLTFQNDLAEAELGKIRAVIDYNKALVALERAKGTLLEARGMRLQ